LKLLAISGYLLLLLRQSFVLSPVSDLSLSGYEFYDDDVPRMRQNTPKESKSGDQLEIGGDTSGAEPTGLITADKVLGTGPTVRETSIVRFFYLILKTNGDVVERNDNSKESPPVRSSST